MSSIGKVDKVSHIFVKSNLKVLQLALEGEKWVMGYLELILSVVVINVAIFSQQILREISFIIAKWEIEIMIH